MRRLTCGQLCLLTSVILVGTSYLTGFWVLEVETRDRNGAARYNVSLRMSIFKNDPFRYHFPQRTHTVTAKSAHLNSTPAPFVYNENITAQELIDNYIPVSPARSYVNCAKLIEGNRDEQKRALAPHPIDSHRTCQDYIDMTKNCTRFISERKYTPYALSQEEADFSIAYSILVYKDIEYFERLLRAIYRPQNYYCVHVDRKASDEYKAAVRGVAACFDNVMMAPREVDVQWAYFSVVEPELLCMQQLWQHKKWKYFINLTGQEFPLKTNLELVQILKVLNGANNMDGTVRRRNVIRTQVVHRGIMPTSQKKKPCPIKGIQFTKGSVHIVAQRGFVDYVLHDPDALQLREWIKDTGVPDETFFTSLNYSPELMVPGSYLGEPETDKIDTISPAVPRNPFIARYKNWGDGPFAWPCGGKRVRQVCIMGVKDLPRLATRKELFVNKFNSDFQTDSYDCLEELHYNRTRQEVIEGMTSLDLKFYAQLDFVKNHI